MDNYVIASQHIFLSHVFLYEYYSSIQDMKKIYEKLNAYPLPDYIQIAITCVPLNMISTRFRYIGEKCIQTKTVSIQEVTMKKNNLQSVKDILKALADFSNYIKKNNEKSTNSQEINKEELMKALDEMITVFEDNYLKSKLEFNTFFDINEEVHG